MRQAHLNMRTRLNPFYGSQETEQVVGATRPAMTQYDNRRMIEEEKPCP